MNAHATRILSKLKEIHKSVDIMAGCHTEYDEDQQVVRDIADVIKLCEDIFDDGNVGNDGKSTRVPWGQLKDREERPCPNCGESCQHHDLEECCNSSCEKTGCEECTELYSVPENAYVCKGCAENDPDFSLDDDDEG